MSFGKAQPVLPTDGLSWPPAEATESSPFLLVPEHDWAGRGLGVAASSAQDAGTPCQQLLESTSGSKTNAFPASMETCLKMRASRPSSGPPGGFQESPGTTARLGLHRSSSEYLQKGLWLLPNGHPWGWQSGYMEGPGLSRILSISQQHFHVWSALCPFPPPQWFKVPIVQLKTPNRRL